MCILHHCDYKSGTRRPTVLRPELLPATTVVKKGMSLGTVPTKGNQKLATNATRKDILLATAQVLLRPVVVADPNATNADKRVILQEHVLKILVTIRDEILASIAVPSVTLAEERAI